MKQLNLLDWYPRGETADITRDGKRLGEQLQAVWAFVSDGEWHTLGQISEATQAPEASVSARLRDLRRLGKDVERQYVTRGLHKYRILNP